MTAVAAPAGAATKQTGQVSAPAASARRSRLTALGLLAPSLFGVTVFLAIPGRISYFK